MKDRIYTLLNDPSQPQVRPSALREWTEEEREGLRKLQMTANYRLSAKLAHQREKLVAKMVENGKRYLQLREKTVELAIRMFDLYCLRISEGVIFDGRRVLRGEKGRWVLEKKEEAELVVVTCMFTCSKYNEIYPPALSDIIFIFQDKFSKNDIIRRELQLLHITDFGFQMSTLIHWFQHYYTVPLPGWAIDCYQKCYGRMEQVAISVFEVSEEETTSTSSIAARVGLVQKVAAKLRQKDEYSRKNI